MTTPATQHAAVPSQPCPPTPPPTATDDAARLAALASFEVVGPGPTRRTTTSSAWAAGLFDAPMAMISLVDERQWFKAGRLPRVDRAVHLRTIPVSGLKIDQSTTDDAKL